MQYHNSTSIGVPKFGYRERAALRGALMRSVGSTRLHHVALACRAIPAAAPASRLYTLSSMPADSQISESVTPGTDLARHHNLGLDRSDRPVYHSQRYEREVVTSIGQPNTQRVLVLPRQLGLTIPQSLQDSELHDSCLPPTGAYGAQINASATPGRPGSGIHAERCWNTGTHRRRTAAAGSAGLATSERPPSPARPGDPRAAE